MFWVAQKSFIIKFCEFAWDIWRGSKVSFWIRMSNMEKNLPNFKYHPVTTPYRYRCHSFERLDPRCAQSISVLLILRLLCCILLRQLGYREFFFKKIIFCAFIDFLGFITRYPEILDDILRIIEKLNYFFKVK